MLLSHERHIELQVKTAWSAVYLVPSWSKKLIHRNGILGIWERWYPIAPYPPWMNILCVLTQFPWVRTNVNGQVSTFEHTSWYPYWIFCLNFIPARYYWYWIFFKYSNLLLVLYFVLNFHTSPVLVLYFFENFHTRLVLVLGLKDWLVWCRSIPGIEIGTALVWSW
jgi:hypothetical protein